MLKLGLITFRERKGKKQSSFANNATSNIFVHTNQKWGARGNILNFGDYKRSHLHRNSRFDVFIDYVKFMFLPEETPNHGDVLD